MPPNLLAAVEEEILQEKSATLFRSAHRLENALAELQQLELRARDAGPEERRRLALAHAELRKDARQFHWFLVIEREALGLRDHSLLDELYRLPGPLAP